MTNPVSEPKITSVLAPNPTGDERSDVDLMEAIKESSAEALEELYDRYSGVLKAIVMRVLHNDTEADDLLQEVFVEIWNQAFHFSAEKGKPLGWMVTLTRRRAIDRLRKKQSYQRVEERLRIETEQQPEAWIHDTIDNDLEISDMGHILMRIIGRLPPAQQQAIDLAFYKGMSQREIAAHTSIPLGTIKTRIELGLKKIGEALKGVEVEF
jgi:RNA polymerase sigma-70 factor (ECF subfamily)